jgi:hypothetical protein
MDMFGFQELPWFSDIEEHGEGGDRKRVGWEPSYITSKTFYFVFNTELLLAPLI